MELNQRWIVIAGLLAIGLTGCFDGEEEAAKQATPGSAVAVIDLDEVAKRLGRDKSMENALTTRQEELNQNLVTMQEGLREQLTKRQEELGEAASEEDQQKLMQLQQEAGNRVSAAIEDAQVKLQEERKKMVAQFREEVQPHVRKAASDMGADLVVTRNDNVIFHHTPEINITDAVVSSMIKERPDGGEANAKPAPTIPDLDTALKEES